MHEQVLLLGAERAVLGAILLDPDGDALDRAAEVVGADDFLIDENRMVFRAAMALREAGRPIEAIGLFEALRLIGGARYWQDDVSFLEFANSLLGVVPHGYAVEEHAAIVRERSDCRRLAEALGEALQATSRGFEPAQAILGRVEGDLLRIAERGRSGRDESCAGDLAEIQRDRARRLEGRDDRLGTGLAAIDDLVGGLPPGEIVVVGARPRIGKSSLMLRFAEEAAVACGVGTLVFSLEMSRKSILMRLVSGISGVPISVVCGDSPADPNQEAEIDRAVERIRSAPLQIVDLRSGAGAPAGELCAYARRRVRRDNVRLVIFDYLQLITPDPGAARESTYASVSDTIKRLRLLAGESGAAVACGSQLARAAATAGDGRPRLHNLRDSGAIEAEADKVLLIHRDEIDGGAGLADLADLMVAKNRSGNSGTCQLKFIPCMSRFEDLAFDGQW